MASSLALLELLQQLFKRHYRQDKAFDKYQIKFLKKFQNISNDEEEAALLKECSKQLSAIPNALEDKLSEGRFISRHSIRQLRQVASLSNSIKSKLNDMQNSAAYSVIEHQVELNDLIKIYQKAVIELSQRSMQSDCDNKNDVAFINKELQQVILELDIGESHVKDLEKLRIKICNEDDHSQLPYHCLQVIKLIIKSTREERTASRHFLYMLNDNLSEFYSNFSKTLSSTEAGFVQQKETFISIESNAQLLKQQSEEIQDLAQLRAHIKNYVSEVQHVITAQEKKKEQKFRHKFQSMVRQIKKLQNETQSYQKTLKQQNKQLHVDFLTKISNRAAWSERLEIEMLRFKTYQKRLNIAIIDIDNFKRINDNFGHLAGDKVLHVIAQTLQKSIRKNDYIARFGGEEFTLLLPEITEQQSAYVLNKLRERIKNIPFKFKNDQLSITVSIGYTSFCESDDTEIAFERADNALYQAKHKGRDQVVYGEPNIKVFDKVQ
ncbi:GGDEF domain-containing protein [Psychromonas sp. SR45-3]|uniref:GGDEF domain-containing protein n=1 Tax=Psychromonas sp. SR45-3 TaxID=2760930 RepID=UPI0015FA56A7|nr:GGDEF domain-containing protein [Psychromonas sp. SR45-3]MBB1272360.1 GGDEF domain-containing protein [Psychromonas sp. SR45-3]